MSEELTREEQQKIDEYNSRQEIAGLIAYFEDLDREVAEINE